MTPRVVVFVGPDHDLYHTSRLLTGFCALADRGAIDLRYERPRGDDQWLAADPVVVCFDVSGPATRRVAVDLRDGEGWSRPILDRVDLYLKRAFYRPELRGLPETLAAKVEPYGLNYACRSTASTLRLLRTIGAPILARGARSVAALRQFLSMPAPGAFEQSPESPVDTTVIFQTRLWTADEVPPEEVEPLNTERVAIVRALRHAFGPRFVGGLLPTPLALSRYPDEVTPHPARKRAYVALKKRSLVAVYTRGIEHSLAFKLGETLAASQCLVSVALRQELPEPLVSGRHYLPFDTPDACVEACERLLVRPDLAREMRRVNHEYYLTEVEPASHGQKIIVRSVSRPRTQSA